ncbi:MAG TPA: family 43 glycosylhydrolase [bacterium]|nr:family 43 glycosylhydrolase [bacterium]
MKRIFIILLCALVPAVSFASTGIVDDEEYFIFAFFRHGEKTYIDHQQFFSGGAGVYLAWSKDGLNWTEIGNKKHFFKPKIGKTLRDPTVIRGPGGEFHLVWTTGWQEKTIGYASSKDLINWENVRLLPVMKHEKSTLNSWAPEIFYDDINSEFLIFWSSTIKGKFEDARDPGDSVYNHRIYYTSTADFDKFKKPALFYDPGFNCIDASILKHNGKYLMFIKNEVAQPPAKYIMMTSGDSPAGPFEKLSPRISPENVWAEGPYAIEIGGSVFVYYDMFREDRMGLVVSDDLVNWEDYTGRLVTPGHSKHGSFLKVTGAELQKLLRAAE